MRGVLAVKCLYINRDRHQQFKKRGVLAIKSINRDPHQQFKKRGVLAIKSINRDPHQQFKKRGVLAIKSINRDPHQQFKMRGVFVISYLIHIYDHSVFVSVCLSPGNLATDYIFGI
jgi:hypothetical protein